VLRQGTDGTIHLVTTQNAPCLHFAFNEAWLLSHDETPEVDASLMANSAGSIGEVVVHEEKYPDGRTRLTWSAGIASDGRYLQQGPERWYFPDGKLQYEADYVRGEKTGAETLYSGDGGKIWEWNHGTDGRDCWTQFWPNGKMKAQSFWKSLHADGPAKRWSPEGALLSEVLFTHGDAELK
jgi:antitoxin component YwqK of YwqJK toxin-antitoxin module